MEYYAKSEGNITVEEHCLSVSDAACGFGKSLGLSGVAGLCGMVHDFGKYGALFQRLLRGMARHVDHAFPSAVFLYCMFGGRFLSCVEVVAGHHSRLRSYLELIPEIKAFSSGDFDGIFSDRQISFSDVDEFKNAVLAFSKAFNAFLEKFSGSLPYSEDFSAGNDFYGRFEYMLKTRFLYSCQVDADWSVSGDIPYGLSRVDAQVCIDRLESVRSDIIVKSRADARVNALRDSVYGACVASGRDGTYGFMSLTAPTGSGKMMAMLRFALERYSADASKKRIIFVLPFLSVSEQVEDLIKDVMPEYIVDNSLSDNADNREACSSWSSPCIITTTVQFFGSLCSDLPGDCRKLHSMADSIIIFDEVQALPVPFMRLAAWSLRYLVERCNSVVLLSTATQPAFAHMPGVGGIVHEVIPDVKSLFGLVERTGIRFCDSPLRLDDVALMALDYNSCCVIVNLKRPALAVFRIWKDMGLDNIFLLSTDLCPAHRLDVIQEIKRLQRAGKPVHVVATQCIEAGVDLDFQMVYRAMAPLPALLQSAGRQNRNGIYPHSDMMVFELVRDGSGEKVYPGPDYEQQACVVKSMLGSGMDVGSVSGIEEYYRILFKHFNEPASVIEAVDNINYGAYRRETRLIKRGGVQVVVPYNDTYHVFHDKVMSGKVSKRDLFSISRCCVSVYDMDSVEAHCQEVKIYNSHSKDYVSTGVWVLLSGHELCYNYNTGLEWQNEVLVF